MTQPILLVGFSLLLSQSWGQICNNEISPCIIGRVNVNNFRCGTVVAKADTSLMPRIQLPEAKEVENQNPILFKIFVICC